MNERMDERTRKKLMIDGLPSLYSLGADSSSITLRYGCTSGL